MGSSVMRLAFLGMAMASLLGCGLLLSADEPKPRFDLTYRPKMNAKRTDVKPFETVAANVPFYRQGGKPGQTLKEMQLPLDAAESVKHMVLPVGFEAQLFAAEPDLGGKPICMNWDERGRLWVAVTIDYPNELQPEGKGRDKIVICEDTKGTGRADKFTVFADKLSIPTSFVFARGGIILHQAPQTLFFRDTNGDDVADERIILFSGWSTGDTHAGPSNLNQGLDNWIYGIVGYSGFKGRIGGEYRSFSTGFYRFKLPGREPPTERPAVAFEFLRNTSNNSWGVGFNEEGVLFGSTANGNPSVHLPVPNRYYERVRGWSSNVLGTIAEDTRFYPITDKVRQVDYHGRFTAAAGHAIYTARTYPPEYWNRTAFVCEPTGHLCATFQIQSEGATYRTRNSWNLVASDDEWTSPIMAEVGPDGHVWVIDWYNFIVQHNPTPPTFRTGRGNAYETELRDKKHGRIYRIVYKDAKPAAALTLKNAAPEKLAETLTNDNLFWRRHAQRLLVERGKSDIVAKLIALTRDRTTDAIGLNPGAIHALWTLHGLGALDGSNKEALTAATAALGHPSAGVRRNAALVLPPQPSVAQAILDAGLLKDANPQVRLAALLALADQKASPNVAQALAALLEDDTTMDDRWLRDALTSAAAVNDYHFLMSAATRKWNKPASSGAVALITRVGDHHARLAPTTTVAAALRELGKGEPAVVSAILAGWAKGWPSGQTPKLTEDDEKALAGLLPRLPAAGRGHLVALANRWGSKALEKHADEIRAAVAASIKDAKASDEVRLAAAAQLIDLGKADAKAVAQILAAITPQLSPELARGLLDAIRNSDAKTAGQLVIDELPRLTPAIRPAALRLLLAKTDWTIPLIEAIEKGDVQLADLALDQKLSLANHPNKDVAARAKTLLAKGGGLPNPDRAKVLEELMPLTMKTGDAGRGKAVFKKHCAQCHMHTGDGANIGPDLTGMAVHTKAHLLAEVIDPSRNVEGNYREYLVMTKRGDLMKGLLASETMTSIELIDAEAKKHILQRSDIDKLQASGKSIMPDGFEKQAKPEELVDLLEFLTQRGQYLPLPLGKAATIVSTRGMFNSEESTAERLIFADWSSKTHNGVPFQLVNPRDDRVANVILLHGPQGRIPPTMPKAVSLPCNAPAKAIHLLSGVSGWGYPNGQKGSVSLIVRLHYADNQTEEHPLRNGEHFADYIRRVDVPSSEFAFALRSQQMRYLAITPKRSETIREIEFVKGSDSSAPVVMAVTVEVK